MAENTAVESSEMENVHDAQPKCCAAEPEEDVKDDIGGTGPSTIFSDTGETTESHLGDGATFSGEPENDITSAPQPEPNERIEIVPPYFHENGYSVKICGGGVHFKIGDKCSVEMENGKEFAIELSNSNNYGCDVDIQMAKLDLGTEYEDVGGWRLNSGQEKFEILNSGYGQGKFVFYGSNPGKKAGEENVKNEENLKSILKIKFSPEAYSVYFRMRNVKSVTNVRIVKTEGASLLDVLNRWVEKNKLEKEDFSEWRFSDGKKLRRSCMHLSTVAGQQCIRKPLRLLRATEKISVTLNGGKTTEIDVKPEELEHDSSFKEKLTSLFGEGDYQMKAGDEIVTKENCLKCFEVDFVEVTKETKKTEPPKVDPTREAKPTERAGGFRGFESTMSFSQVEQHLQVFGSGHPNTGTIRGFSGCTLEERDPIQFQGYGYNRRRGTSDAFEREEEEVFRGGGRTNRSEPASANEGFVRYEGPPVQAFERVVSNPQFYTSHDDQVVMTIHLVSTSN